MRPKILFPVAHGCIAAILLVASLSGARATSPEPVALNDSIRPVGAVTTTGSINLRKAFISRTTLTANESSATMTFEVALRMRNFAELQARVNKNERVSAQEMVEKYEPFQTDYQAVIDWLTSQGLTITRKDGHHMAIFVSGTVAQIAQAMQAKFARVTLDSAEYSSAITAPSVPASISSLLVGVNGLQPHIHAHKHIIKPNTAGAGPPYTPSQIAQAYQVNGLYNENITGSGQTIAIVIDTFPSTGDLIQFWQTYGINQSINNIQFVQVIAGNLNPPTGEETLDSEWSSSIAPGAKVRIYATLDLGNADLDAGYLQVFDDVTAHPEYGIHQMSMSFGLGEIETTNGQMQTDDQYFVELTNAGVTCFASTGDNGSAPETDFNGTPEVEPESPASDPNVIAVGGTTLTLDSNNNESTEVVWNEPDTANFPAGASGGGTSQYWARESWQKGLGVPAPRPGTSGMRLLPDISSAADPNFGGVTIYAGTVGPTGGTSWSSPTCAGFCALFNEARANAGLGAIGQMGPLIYPLIGTTSFRDITSGSNAVAGSDGLYSATVGYDEATGIGVPLVQTLAASLAQTPTLLGVSVQTISRSVLPGQSATYTINAGGSPVTYQWQRMAAGTTTWSDLADSSVYSGSATTTLTVNNATTTMNGDLFQCVVTYAGSKTVTSAPTCVLSVEIPWIISTLAGNSAAAGLTNSTGTAAQFDYPTGMTIDNSGNIYVADLINNEIRKVTPQGVVTAPYGSLSGASGSTNGAGNAALFNSPRDVAYDSTNNLLYVADEVNNLIRKITLSTGQVSNFAGPFNEPRGVAVDGSGNVYVADSVNNVIRKITSAGSGSILAGSNSFAAGYKDATGSQALFNQPIGIAVDGSGNVYVADYGNAAVRKITSGGVVTTLAGQGEVGVTVAKGGPVGGAGGYMDGPGSKSLLNLPRGIAVDHLGNVYVTDSYAPVVEPPPAFSGNNLLRKITPAGVISTLAGMAGIAGSVNNTGAAAEFYNPCGVAINSNGTIYIADAGNNTIRAGVVQTTVSVSATKPFASVTGPVDGQFTVTRTGSTAASLAVNYSLSGTAANGTDYSSLSGSVTILAGQSSATIAVDPRFDSGANTNRTVILTLTSSISGVLIDTTPATVTISEAQPVMYTDWLNSFPNPPTGAAAAPTATPLNDGIPNLLKYLFDIDPTVPVTAADRAILPTVGTTTISGSNYETLTYREYASTTGVTINVQTSQDLQTWTTLTNPTITQTGIDATTGDPILQAHAPITAFPQFIRLDVTQP